MLKNTTRRPWGSNYYAKMSSDLELINLINLILFSKANAGQQSGKGVSEPNNVNEQIQPEPNYNREEIQLEPKSYLQYCLSLAFE